MWGRLVGLGGGQACAGIDIHILIKVGKKTLFFFKQRSHKSFAIVFCKIPNTKRFQGGSWMMFAHGTTSTKQEAPSGSVSFGDFRSPKEKEENVRRLLSVLLLLLPFPFPAVIRQLPASAPRGRGRAGVLRLQSVAKQEASVLFQETRSYVRSQLIGFNWFRKRVGGTPC